MRILFNKGGPPVEGRKRKGAILVLSVFFLAGILTFVGMSVDLGFINVTKSRMQTTADACALAAAQEIVAAIQDVGAEGGDGEDVEDAHAYAEGRARQVAFDIAQKNGLYLDKDRDVDFGRRSWNAQSGQFEVDWSGSPYNAVKITLRKDNSDPTKGDAKLQLMFAPVLGDKSIALRASAAAYVEARDFVSVLDYSGSMNFDSIPYKSGLSQSSVKQNLNQIYDELVASNAYFSNDSTTLKFPAGGWGKLNSYTGGHRTGSTDDIYDELELASWEEVIDPGEPFYTGWGNPVNGWYYTTLNGRSWKAKASNGQLYKRRNNGQWKKKSHNNFRNAGGSTERVGRIVEDHPYKPYPQEGRYNNGNFKGKPNEPTSETLWKDYISWVRSNSDDGHDSKLYVDSNNDHRNKYNFQTWGMYVLEKRRYNDESEDLWRVSAYPYKAVKDGMSMFNEFLTGLQFGDTLGLVSYATTAKKMNYIDDSDVSMPNSVTDVNLGSNVYMTQDYCKIESIQLHHQASHYSGSTNIGDGINYARQILENEGRTGARWQMIVMTDGAVNKPDSLPSLPAGWNVFDWNNLTDWTGDGIADYNDTDIATGNWDGGTAAEKYYVFYRAKQAIEKGITIHTMAVGNGADTKMMRALATMGKGVYIHIPGGSTAETMSATLEEKFSLLAGNVPPAKLLYEE